MNVLMHISFHLRILVIVNPYFSQGHNIETNLWKKTNQNKRHCLGRSGRSIPVFDQQKPIFLPRSDGRTASATHITEAKKAKRSMASNGKHVTSGKQANFSEPRISDRKTTGETRSNAICLAPRPKKPKSVIMWNDPPKYGKVHPTSAINSGKTYDSK